MDFAARDLTNVICSCHGREFFYPLNISFFFFFFSFIPLFSFPPADPIKSRTRTDFSPAAGNILRRRVRGAADSAKDSTKECNENVTMLAGWFARDSRPAIRERKFLNGTYVPTYAHVRADECLGTYVPGIRRAPDALCLLIDAVKKESFELNGTCRG